MVQGHGRVDHVLQTVRGVHEIDVRIGHARHVLRIAIGHVPGAAAAHERKELVVLPERIAPGPDVDALPHQVARGVARIAQLAKDGFAGFMHGRLLQRPSCKKCSA